MIFIDSYAIDVAISEGHTLENQVTDHQVEKGSNFTDHSRPKSIKLAYEGLVSNTPLGPLRFARIGVTPASDAYDRLVAIRNAQTPVVVEDSLGVYPSMLLETLSPMRGSKDPNTALHFNVTFVEARTVSNERTFVRVSTPSAAGKRNLGTKPTDKDAQGGKPKGELYESWALKAGKQLGVFGF